MAEQKKILLDCYQALIDEYSSIINSPVINSPLCSIYLKSLVINENNEKMRCGAIIFNAEFNKVLVVKNKSCQKWGFPKGGSDKNEDVISCAIREVKEETGLNLYNQGKFLECIKLDKYFYLVVHMNEQTKFHIEDTEEISEVKFVHITKIPSLYSNSNLKTFHRKYMSKELRFKHS